MTRQRWLLVAALVVLAAVAGWWFLRANSEHVATDLVAEFPHAKDRRPSPDVFSIIDATLGGVTKRAIFTAQPSRIIWHVTVPENAWFKASLGLKEEAWTMPGDGVLYQIGVSDGKTYDPLLEVLINPFGNPADRHWDDVMIDLSQYAGESVDIICNAYSGPKGHDDRNGDLALWGAPRIVIR